MADRVIIHGVPPYDGTYELDWDREFTVREWGWIKRHAGYLPLTIGGDAFADPELISILAVIVLRRAGTIQPDDVPRVFDRFLDAPFGSTITIEGDTVEEDGSDPLESSNGNDSFSGTSSTTSSETSPPTPPASGNPNSAISASDPRMLVT